ncbi:hypothetical protein ABZ570_29410 [Micromonospora sp. NPDC007271]|uniref:hypothetical protein n=1 Tax=Micromonospora sp. NPDC007271 TaxID=3154587 RepID=UPI0033EB1827
MVKRFGWSRRCLGRRICGAWGGVREVDPGRDGEECVGGGAAERVTDGVALGVTERVTFGVVLGVAEE